MYFNVSFDSSVSNAPAGFKACVNAVCQYYDALFTNNVTVTFNAGWGEVGGQKVDPGALGESSAFYAQQNYAAVAAALAAQNAPGAATLPAASPAASGSTLQVNMAEARALGLPGAISSDGSVGFDSTATWFFDPTQSKAVPANAFDFFGTVEHEISEVMGRSSDLNIAGTYAILDLFRYASSGVRQLTTGDPSFFSVDGGKTLLQAFNNFQTGDTGGDLGDWASTVTALDSFGYGSAGVASPVTAIDKTVMAALGWTTTSASTALSVAASVPTLSAAGAVSAINNQQDNFVAVSDSGANVSAQLDGLETLAKNGNLSAITLTSAALTVSAAQLTGDADALALISGSYTVGVSDSAANITANLSSLAGMATAGTLTSLHVTDGAAITMTAAQMTSDAALLKLLSGNYSLTIDASAGTGLTLSGIAGHGAVVELGGTASQYTLTPKGDGAGFTIASSTVSDQISGITALSFGGTLDFVATTPGPANAITSGNITELYGAVFGRLPDVSGLAFYQAYLTANPSVGLTTYATYFLSSGEYTGSHNYAQTTAGESQFVADIYTNLLHRAASASEVSFYYDKVIAPAIAGLTPGSAAYASADLAAHAQVLTYFSQSTEFLGDVQITAQHPADSAHWLYLI